MPWEHGSGIVELPSGARLRGRGLRSGVLAEPRLEWGLYLLGRPPADLPWPSLWLPWPDFWLPSDRRAARSAFREAHERALAGQRVEIACRGGVGRTGTALACVAQLDGVAAKDAIAWVRERYHRRAVETPWQRRFVRRFGRDPGIRGQSRRRRRLG